MILSFLTKDNLSHVGMVIHSTTLDTESKVKAIYGGKSWTKIEGRMLLGQSDSYEVNSVGGEASHTLTIAEMPAHTHGLNNHTHSVPNHTHTMESAGEHTHNLARKASGTTGDNYMVYPSSDMSVSGSTVMSAAGSHTHTIKSSGACTTGKASGNTTSNGSGKAHNNMPPYKVVYIWERVS